MLYAIFSEQNGMASVRVCACVRCRCRAALLNHAQFSRVCLGERERDGADDVVRVPAVVVDDRDDEVAPCELGRAAHARPHLEKGEYTQNGPVMKHQTGNHGELGRAARAARPH